MIFKRNFHKLTYNRDADGTFKIPVALRKYEDIYSDWDPSPFKRRDIEEDFLEYIWDSALDIPLREKILVVFRVKSELRDDKKEEQVLKAIENHFNYAYKKSKRAYFEEQKESLIYFVIGIILGILVYSDIFYAVNIWTKVLEEGVMIGTWVFFWEAFYNLFIQSRSLKYEQKMIKRFLKTDFIFESI